MAVTVFEPALCGFFDTSGVPLASGKVYTYAEGTTTDKATYPTRTDAEGATNANANPVILDSYGAAEIWLASSGLYKFVITDADDASFKTFDEYGDETDVNVLPANYISGLATSNGTDTDHDIDVATGECRDAADSFDITVSATITAAIDASGANGIDSGAVAASTLYAFWLIADSGGDNDPAGLFSTSFTNPTLPSGYDKKRLIGSVKTNGSANIIQFSQSGDYFRYTGDVVTDVADTSITSDTFETGTLSVPPSSLAEIYASVANATGTDDEMRVHVRTNGAADAAVSQEAWGDVRVLGDSTVIPAFLTGVGTVLVDSNSQIEYAAYENSGTSTVAIRTLGFQMLTRRDP